jgi:DNA-binding NtrC family response regulator
MSVEIFLKESRQLENKVLFVDDDSNILDAYKRQLRKQFHIDTAQGSEHGLAAVNSSGPYAVIVSDLRMPGMDGIQFLSRVKEIVPDSVRMMLTGYADLQNAIKAINSGNIFRLLTKPCTPKELAEALVEACEQYDKNTRVSDSSDKYKEAQSRKKVLILDDDLQTLKMLSAALKKNEDLEVLKTRDGRVAIHCLKNSKIDLIITELDVQGINGTKLVAYINKNFPETPVIVHTGRGTDEVENQIRSLENVRYFEKPLDINILVETALRELHAVPAAQIWGISTASFLQVIDMEQRICTLTVRSDEKLGYLYFMKGDLIAAEAGDQKGLDAAYNIIGWEKSVIEMKNTCRKKEREIHMPLMHVLMESARIKDDA